VARILFEESRDHSHKFDAKLEGVSKHSLLQVSNGVSQGLCGLACSRRIKTISRERLTCQVGTKRLAETYAWACFNSHSPFSQRYTILKTAWEGYLRDFEELRQTATPTSVDVDYGGIIIKDVQYTFSKPDLWDSFQDKWHIHPTMGVSAFQWTGKLQRGVQILEGSDNS
jgi:hypothetical protein